MKHARATIAGSFRSRRVRRAGAVLLALVTVPFALLALASLLLPLPGELTATAEYVPSTRLLDRNGLVLREVRADDGARARWVPLSEVGAHARSAMIAAEDRRFFEHPGIDPVAMVRALGQAILARRVVSGASTLTQQLARNVVLRPRTLMGKLHEMALALRIERSLSKDRILEEYLNRAPFGPGLRGIEAASRFYFDKPTRELSLAEAAALASMPRGPSLYDPRKGTARLHRRRDRVLGRMEASGLASHDEVRRAMAEPLAVASVPGGLGAPHFARGVMAGTIDPAAGPLAGRAAEIATTLDARLQREVETAARATVRSLASRHVSAAAVVVLENRTGEILAYVGAPDLSDAEALGENDGVLARRQPGSTLKPFVYELAFERLGMTTATVLPDVDLHLGFDGADYHPSNYDGRLHGPVRVREALANSYNVPAVWTVSQLGPDVALERLRALGLASLDRSPEYYGAALALGDGEVRLLDLAGAYATLARGGELVIPTAIRRAVGPRGELLSRPPREGRRVLDATAAALVTDILADRTARLASFGERSVLELPFPAAAKTGTSKGFRDNLAIGFTPDVTVAVWVGNFDGSPMHGVSGVTGAGPLLHDALIAAMRGREPSAFPLDPDAIDAADVCPLSGAVPTGACSHRHRELFAKGTAPRASCAMHEEVRTDRRNGLRAGLACDATVAETRVYEAFAPEYVAWAREAGRPLAPAAWSPLCPGPGHDRAPPDESRRPRIVFPVDGATFAWDPAASARQTVRIRATVPTGARRVRLILDGAPGRALDPPYMLDWPLAPGEHRAHVEAEGAPPGEEIAFSVE